MRARLGVLGWSLVSVVTLTVVLGLALGWRPVVLVSDSMAPGAPAGALLVARPVVATDVQLDDVVTVPDDNGQPVTHRVVGLEELDGDPWARLKGDANELPDPGRVLLVDGTLRTVAVVPVVGRLLAGADAVLLAGLALVGLGVAALALLGRPRESVVVPEGAGGDGGGALAAVGASGLTADPSASASASAPPTGPVSAADAMTPDHAGTPADTDAAVDPRAVALAATLEGELEDGTDLATVRAVARVRTGALVGRGDVERAEQADDLDDGARFVLVAFADADFDALAVVPASSRRAADARAAVDAWWEAADGGLPAGIERELGPLLRAS